MRMLRYQVVDLNVTGKNVVINADQRSDLQNHDSAVWLEFKGLTNLCCGACYRIIFDLIHLEL